MQTVRLVGAACLSRLAGLLPRLASVYFLHTVDVKVFPSRPFIWAHPIGVALAS
ncbi:MAG: hypothetical protein ACETWE_03735 [Candidatus Bathyarchaeia archaeon]